VKAAVALLLFALLILPTLWKVRIMMDRSAAARRREEEGPDGSPPHQ
jgi:hypothetical protein